MSSPAVSSVALAPSSVGRGFAVRAGGWDPVDTLWSPENARQFGNAAIGVGFERGCCSIRNGTTRPERSSQTPHDSHVGVWLLGLLLWCKVVIEKLLDQPQHHLLLGEVLPGRVPCSPKMGCQHGCHQCILHPKTAAQIFSLRNFPTCIFSFLIHVFHTSSLPCPS